MYKGYIEDAQVLFMAPGESTPHGEVLIPESNEVLSVTKLLQKVQITKQITIISPDIGRVFADFCGQQRLIRAGGGVTLNGAGEVLMIFRNGRWDLPKGKLEPGEQIEVCAVREVCEECSLQGVEGGTFITHTYHCYAIKGVWVLKETSWYRMSYQGDQAPQPQVIEGITQAVWVPENQVADRLRHSYFTIRDVFEAAGYNL